MEKGPDVIGKKKQATEIVRQKAKVVKSLPEAAKASAPLVPSVQESEKKAGALQQTPLLIPSVAAGAEQMSGTTPRVRIVKPKPLWTPCPATLSAIETFRVAVQELRGSLSKTGFLPHQVDCISINIRVLTMTQKGILHCLPILRCHPLNISCLMC